MDINLIRIAVMVVGFVAFLGVVWWAYGPSRKKRFERDARSVFQDDARDARQSLDTQPGKDD